MSKGRNIMIKKTFLLLLSSLMLICVSSCGKNDDTNTIYGHFKNLKEAQNYTITTDVVSLKKTETPLHSTQNAHRRNCQIPHRFLSSRRAMREAG